jgi:glycosyltransferase involved in cell wall biosynthesis
LDAAHDVAQADGREVIALETAGTDSMYAWRPETRSTPFHREVVFPGRLYQELAATTIHHGVTAALDRLVPDAVAITSYSTPDARASLLWCQRHHRPAILMTETKEDDVDRIEWRESIKRRIVGLYSAALVGGTPQRDYLVRLGMTPNAIFLGFDAIDNRFFSERAETARHTADITRHLPDIDGETPYFMASSRFIPRKNLHRLLKAYQHYRMISPAPWRLLLLGDGPERPALAAAVKDLALQGVSFCGFRQIDELPAYYAHAGAFVHPALVDQWGLVVNEAMAAGLPVLVSERAGCAQDLVQHGVNGFTFDPENVPELARLLSVLSHPDTDRAGMGEASRRIIADWSPARFASGLWAAVDYAAGRPRRPAPIGRALLWTIQRLSRRVDSFHSVRD